MTSFVSDHAFTTRNCGPLAIFELSQPTPLAGRFRRGPRDVGRTGGACGSGGGLGSVERKESGGNPTDGSATASSPTPPPSRPRPPRPYWPTRWEEAKAPPQRPSPLRLQRSRTRISSCVLMPRPRPRPCRRRRLRACPKKALARRPQCSAGPSRCRQGQRAAKCAGRHWRALLDQAKGGTAPSAGAAAAGSAAALLAAPSMSTAALSLQPPPPPPGPPYQQSSVKEPLLALVRGLCEENDELWGENDALWAALAALTARVTGLERQPPRP